MAQEGSLDREGLDGYNQWPDEALPTFEPAARRYYEHCAGLSALLMGAVAESMGLDLDYYLQVFGVGLPGAPTGSMPSGEGADDGAPTLEVVADPEADAPGDQLSRTEILRLVASKLSDQE